MNSLKHILDVALHFNYRNVYSQRVSQAVSVVLSLFFVLFLVSCVKLYVDFTYAFNNFEKAMQNAPYFTIKNGVLNLDAPQPYYPIPEDGGIVVDTTGKTSPSVIDDKVDGVFVDRTKVYVKSNYDTRSFDLKLLNEMSNLSSVTRNDITSWVMDFKTPLYIMATIFMGIYQCFAKAFSAMFLSLLLLTTASIMRKKMRFSTIFNISLYSLVVPIILYWIRMIANIYIPWFALFYWIVAIVYGVMGVRKFINPVEPDMIVV